MGCANNGVPRITASYGRPAVSLFAFGYGNNSKYSRMHFCERVMKYVMITSILLFNDTVCLCFFRGLFRIISV